MGEPRSEALSFCLLVQSGNSHVVQDLDGSVTISPCVDRSLSGLYMSRATSFHGMDSNVTRISFFAKISV